MTAVGLAPHVTTPVAAAPAAAAAPSANSGFSFSDLLDIVNPLQHIPIVSTLYRAITGDQIKTFPKIAGDTLFGGITGFVSSVADTIFEKITGKNFGDTALALVEDAFSSPSTGVASVASPATTLAAASPATPVAVSPASLGNIPGKSFGDRVLAWVENQFSSPPSAVAAVTSASPSGAALQSVPAAVAPAALDSIVIPGQDALLLALTRKSIDQDLALRAASAYRSTLNVAGTAASAALH
jgi:hypothetical protein